MNPIVTTLIVLGILFVLLVVWARSAGRPGTLGLRDGQLAPCPDTPNCVSTGAEDPSQQMEAIAFTGTPEEARSRLLAVVRSMPRTRVITEGEDYLHVEFRTPVIGFIDDVEFLIDGDDGRIHFRSASRLGQSDFGVNRKRMEEVTRRFGGAD
jgi:uncharacterized protein (DUF1499 family)